MHAHSWADIAGLTCSLDLTAATLLLPPPLLLPGVLRERTVPTVAEGVYPPLSWLARLGLSCRARSSLCGEEKGKPLARRLLSRAGGW